MKKIFGCLAIAIFVMGCSSSSGDGDKNSLSDTTSRLDNFGFELVFSGNGEDSDRPVLFIGGLRNDEILARQLGVEFDCRNSVYDAVYRLSPRRSSSELESPEKLREKIRSALSELVALGFKNVAVVGHNTGGLVARAALASSQIGALPLQIQLITFFTPFAGLNSESTRAGYSEDFVSGTDFISDPGQLPSNVTHQKLKLDVGRSSLLFTGSEPDAVFPQLQDNGVVDNDPQRTNTETVSVPFWPFGFDTALRSALDASGLPENSCPGFFDGLNPDDFPDTAKIGSASTLKTQAVAREGSIAFDKTDFAQNGLQAPTLPGNAIDASKPVMLMVHGIRGSASQFDQLEARESQNYNVFRFVYDESANALGAEFTGTTQGFSHDSDDVEVISDRLVSAARKLQTQFELTDLTVVGHDVGGLIARRSMTVGRSQTLSDSGMKIVLVAVAAPFGGFSVENFDPVFWLSLGYENANIWYSSAASSSSFISAPGSLGSNIFFGKVETIESGSSQISEPIDSVLNLSNQENATVDGDARLLTGGAAGAGVFRFRAGHVGILQTDVGLSLLVPAIAAFENRKAEITTSSAQ